MEAVGAGMPNLEELVMENIYVTDEGWRKFAKASIAAAAAAAPAVRNAGEGGDAKPTLRRLSIQTSCSQSIPSGVTRDLLEKAVGESVTLYVNPYWKSTLTAGSGSGSGSGGGGGNEIDGIYRYLDCDGGVLPVISERSCSKTTGGGSKLRVVESRGSLCAGRDAGDL